MIIAPFSERWRTELYQILGWDIHCAAFSAK